MTEISAFVGHSFTREDEQVVSSFLTFFGQLEGLLDNFRWKHAKKAEPKDLAEKVLETANGCNVLIAICTRKELVVNESALKPGLFNDSRMKASRTDFAWKTSDWVIQEIGLAVGRGMSVIILLEDGCRKPGGLQGDVEYIAFERSAPERAQGQLLEMLKALTPSPTSAAPKASAISGEEQPIVEGGEPEQEKNPDASWKIVDFENEYFWALYRNRPERADQISASFVSSLHAKDDEEQASWRAKTESWKLVLSKGGSLAEIRAQSVKYRENTKILSALALALSHLGQEEEAARLYAQAAGLEGESSGALGHLTSAASRYMRAGNRREAEAAIERIKEIVEPGQESLVAKTLKSIADIIKDNYLNIEAMEAIARFEPDDQDNRFSLAYAHSEIGNPELALHHYLQIPSSERTPTTWNNLGVAYQNLSVPGRAVSAYKQAAGSDETLAMSNLAYRLMSAGFFDEAGTEISRAMKIEKPHRNVGEAYAHLTDLPQNESTSVDEIEQKAKSKNAFYRDLSQAIIKPTINAVGKNWTGPKGQVSMRLSGSDFFAEQEHEVKGNALAGLIVSKSSRYRTEFKGHMVGRRVQGTLKETKLNGPTSIFGDLDSERTFAIIFDEDAQNARVVENLEKRSPSFYDLRLSDEPPASED